MVKGHCSPDKVFHHRGPHGGNFKTQNPSWTRGEILFPAGTIVFGFTSCGQGLLTFAFEFFGGALAVIGLALLVKPTGIFPIDLEALRLKVGTFIPIKTKPFQGLPDGVHIFLPGALPVGVLKTEDEEPSVVSGK